MKVASIRLILNADRSHGVKVVIQMIALFYFISFRGFALFGFCQFDSAIDCDSVVFHEVSFANLLNANISDKTIAQYLILKRRGVVTESD